MTRLDKPKVSTDPRTGWPFYAVHVMSSNLLREFFLVSNYERCIKHADGYYLATEATLKQIERVKGPHPHRTQLLAGAKELTNWVRKMASENYHELYVNAFIGMWSSFEAGMENVVADFLANDKDVAHKALDALRSPPVRREHWPWDQEQCLVAARTLAQAANRSSKAPWWDTLARTQELFACIGVQFSVEESVRVNLSEANAVRNILLHRYGQVGQKAAIAFPELAKLSGSVVAFDRARFNRYYNAVSAVVIALLSSIGATHGSQEGNG